ncbi:hypothetical protein Ancab_007575 [Ancistrocladus abbreviatus]
MPELRKFTDIHVEWLWRWTMAITWTIFRIMWHVLDTSSWHIFNEVHAQQCGQDEITACQHQKHYASPSIDGLSVMSPKLRIGDGRYLAYKVYKIEELDAKPSSSLFLRHQDIMYQPLIHLGNT